MAYKVTIDLYDASSRDHVLTWIKNNFIDPDIAEYVGSIDLTYFGEDPKDIDKLKKELEEYLDTIAEDICRTVDIYLHEPDYDYDG
jgi:hypothetical protein